MNKSIFFYCLCLRVLVQCPPLPQSSFTSSMHTYSCTPLSTYDYITFFLLTHLQYISFPHSTLSPNICTVRFPSLEVQRSLLTYVLFFPTNLHTLDSLFTLPHLSTKEAPIPLVTHTSHPLVQPHTSPYPITHPQPPPPLHPENINLHDLQYVCGGRSKPPAGL